MTALVRFALAWSLGLIWARLVAPPSMVLLIMGGVAAVGGLLYREQPRYRQIAGLTVTFCIGASYMLVTRPVFDAGHVAFYNDDPAPVEVVGVVVDEPDVREFHINLRLAAERLQTADVEHAVEGLVLVRAPRYPEYQYGDRLAVRGQLETPPVFDDFSYKEYLARFGIHTMMRRPYITRQATDQGHPFWAAMFQLKGQAARTINQILPEPHAALLNGILLGREQGIPPALYEQFNLTGTSHIIVISGSNISLVAGILLLMGQHLWGRMAAPPLAMGGIVLYTLLVGADAAVSRAAVMGLFWVLAVWVGRPGLALNSLMASAVLLSLFNPLIFWDVGFQLSFMATLGLIILVPPLQRLMLTMLQRYRRTTRLGLLMALLNELLIITLAAQIITGPLILYHFGRFSLVSLLSNLLILPAQPPIMILGALATASGMLWQPLGQMLGWLVWLPLAWSVAVVERTATLPYISLETGPLSEGLVLLLYALIFGAVWWANQPDDDGAPPWRGALQMPHVGTVQTRLLLAVGGAFALLSWLAVLSLPDGKLHVTFLDVGQGDAILITAPNGRQMLIDGGPSATQLSWQLGQQLPFWDRSLDLLLNTHPEQDHLGGLIALLERYTIEQIMVSNVGASSELYRAWEAALQAHGHTPQQAEAGLQLTLSPGVTMTMLSPSSATPAGGKLNNRSVVVRLQMGRISFLLPGDIEAPVERHLLAQDLDLRATVLKSPHHGSNSSSTEQFLRAVNPQLVVIQLGAENRFGHPAPEVLHRYAQHGLAVLRTDQHGPLQFSTDGQRLWVETGR